MLSDCAAGKPGGAREQFLGANGWSGATVTPLAPDASFRRYFRLRLGERRALLMEAPPATENLPGYLRIGAHLSALGLRTPAVYAVEASCGLALIEDLGADTYTRLLGEGASERELYANALEVLARLHRHPDAAAVEAPAYDHDRLLREAALLVEWYLPHVHGEACDEAAGERFLDAWQRVLASLPEVQPTLVLRDFHVDNLMRVAAADGGTDCALLDFQDAMLGPRAYDVMSLFEDARRDVTPALVAPLLEDYHAAAATADRDAFAAWYAVLGAQRHCKVAGLFVRLSRRDGKRDYLGHLPRVAALLKRALQAPPLVPLRRWFDEYLPLA